MRLAVRKQNLSAKSGNEKYSEMDYGTHPF
jgi:hypothetical protein